MKPNGFQGLKKSHLWSATLLPTVIDFSGLALVLDFSLVLSNKSANLKN